MTTQTSNTQQAITQGRVRHLFTLVGGGLVAMGIQQGNWLIGAAGGIAGAIGFGLSEADKHTTGALHDRVTAIENDLDEYGAIIDDLPATIVKTPPPATPPTDDERPPGPTGIIPKAAAVLAFGLLLAFSGFTGCSTSQVTAAYNTEQAVDTATTAAWTLWQSYVTNSKINGTPISADTQTKVSAAFSKVKAAELVAIDATTLAASTTNGAASTQLTLQSTALQAALTDLGTLLATFNIKL